MNQYVHQNPRLHGSYEAEVNNVRNYMSNRIEWMDNKLGFDATALGTEAVKEQQKAEKILINGQLQIRRNGAVYSPEGQLIAK